MSHAAPAAPRRELGMLGAIVEQHRHRLLARLRCWMHGSPLSRRVDPEDIVADTFLVAARRGARLESASPALRYRCLCRMAHDCLIQSWRRETRQRRDVRRDRSWPEQPVTEFESGLFAIDEEPAERAERESADARHAPPDRSANPATALLRTVKLPPDWPVAGHFRIRGDGPLLPCAETVQVPVARRLSPRECLGPGDLTCKVVRELSVRNQGGCRPSVRALRYPAIAHPSVEE